MKIFVVALVALTLLILLIGIAKTLLREGLGPVAILKLLPFVLPIALQFSFPATALFAVSCVYGRMAGDGEIATVKASGISPLKVLQPAMFFAFMLSPLSVLMSDLAVSWGQPGVNRVVMLSIEDVVYRKMEAQHCYTDDKFSIHVRDVDGKRLIYPTVTVRGGGDPIKMRAREGRLSLDHENEALKLELTDSQWDRGGAIQGFINGTTPVSIPLSRAMRTPDQSKRRPRELALRVIEVERLREDARAHAHGGALAAHTGFALLSSRGESIAGRSGRAYESYLRESQRRLTRLRVEPWRRWAEGFSCFCFVIIGAPLAMIARTSDYWTTFGMCFLPIIGLYYPMFILGLEQAKEAVIPPYGVWIGNIMLFFIGAILIQRVRRY